MFSRATVQPNSSWVRHDRSTTSELGLSRFNPCQSFESSGPGTSNGALCPGEGVHVLPSNGLLGMCRWMGSHLNDSTDYIQYNGVTFSSIFNRVTRIGSHIFGTLRVRNHLPKSDQDGVYIWPQTKIDPKHTIIPKRYSDEDYIWPQNRPTIDYNGVGVLGC